MLDCGSIQRQESPLRDVRHSGYMQQMGPLCFERAQLIMNLAVPNCCCQGVAAWKFECTS